MARAAMEAPAATIVLRAPVGQVFAAGAAGAAGAARAVVAVRDVVPIEAEDTEVAMPAFRAVMIAAVSVVALEPVFRGSP